MKFLLVVSLVLTVFYASAKELPDTILPAYSVSAPVSYTNTNPNYGLFQLTFRQASRFVGEENPLGPVQIELSCNGVIQRFTVDKQPQELLVAEGKYLFRVIRNGEYNEIITDSIEIKARSLVAITFNFQRTVWRVEYLKPVIYTYAPSSQETTIAVHPNGAFTFTYPAVREGKWTGTAEPDGSFSTSEKNYPYLFWEGEGQKIKLQSYDRGFVVENKDIVAFLEEKLTAMGMNEREQTDFITFWGPKMAQSKCGFVRFLFNEEYNAIAEINVTPTPDNLFRVYLLWTPMETTNGFSPVTQEIPTMNRTGFCILEWGGSELPAITQISMK